MYVFDALRLNVYHSILHGGGVVYPVVLLVVSLYIYIGAMRLVHSRHANKALYMLVYPCIMGAIDRLEGASAMKRDYWLELGYKVAVQNKTTTKKSVILDLMVILGWTEEQAKEIVRVW